MKYLNMLNGAKVWSILSLLMLIFTYMFGKDDIKDVKTMVFWAVVYITSQLDLWKKGTITLTIGPPKVGTEDKMEVNGKDVQV